MLDNKLFYALAPLVLEILIALAVGIGVYFFIKRWKNKNNR